MIAAIHATLSVAYKEFLHIVRDWRIMLLLLILPPFFTLLFGHAFEAGAITGVPAVLCDIDQSAESGKLAAIVRPKETLQWRTPVNTLSATPDLLRQGVKAMLVIPAGWGRSLKEGTPIPLRLILDGSDTSSASYIEGVMHESLGEFQLAQRQDIIDNLPESVLELGQELPMEVRKQLVSLMEPWTLQSEILYNPKLRFIEFVVPGIIGLILQLLTVTLMACTITRERESGTFSQLMVTSLRRGEIVVGKVLPYLGISCILIAMTIAVVYFHFDVAFRQPAVLALICLLFLLSSLGLGLLISSFCNTQTQAIQFAVFYLLPVFPLSGAFASLDALPANIRFIAQTFPLTHFCHAFRLINMQNASLDYIAGDLIFLTLAAIVTCGGAGLLLSRQTD
ncbi:MAG: type transporter [Chthoniobacteraceae bacterium]|nr:type transporter [Chthoniobacteraceae bacterium]